MENFQIINYIISAIIGLGTGLISSTMFLYCLTKLRPSLSISDKIAYDILKTNGTEQPCYRFKVINRTWRSKIYDIEAELVQIEYRLTDGGLNLFMTKIPLLKNTVWSLNKISEKDTHAEFAFQFITLEEIKDIWHSDVNLELRIKAKHAFSGFTRTVTKRYYKVNNSVKTGSFKFGNNMEIL
ncbi:hypothetical protein [Marinoscillum sp.]|uniref:hypothetical protein n=1 Tax=Marinoscillum sp. TaxID=2024838 RepID=UPI003BAB26C6